MNEDLSNTDSECEENENEEIAADWFNNLDKDLKVQIILTQYQTHMSLQDTKTKFLQSKYNSDFKKLNKKIQAQQEENERLKLQLQSASNVPNVSNGLNVANNTEEIMKRLNYLCVTKKSQEVNGVDFNFDEYIEKFTIIGRSGNDVVIMYNDSIVVIRTVEEYTCEILEDFKLYLLLNNFIKYNKHIDYAILFCHKSKSIYGKQVGIDIVTNNYKNLIVMSAAYKNEYNGAMLLNLMEIGNAFYKQTRRVTRATSLVNTLDNLISKINQLEENNVKMYEMIYDNEKYIDELKFELMSDVRKNDTTTKKSKKKKSKNDVTEPDVEPVKNDKKQTIETINNTRIIIDIIKNYILANTDFNSSELEAKALEKNISKYQFMHILRNNKGIKTLKKVAQSDLYMNDSRENQNEVIEVKDIK